MKGIYDITSLDGFIGILQIKKHHNKMLLAKECFAEIVRQSEKRQPTWSESGGSHAVPKTGGRFVQESNVSERLPSSPTACKGKLLE